MAKLEDILYAVKNQLGAEFLSSDVVGMDGLSIASVALDSSTDSSIASARSAMVMKLATKVASKMEIGTVDDSLVTTDKAFSLTRFLGDGTYYWRVAVTKDATLGIVRMLMTEYKDQVWDAIPR